VRTGVERGFSIQLRQWLRRSSNHVGLSLGTGLLAAVLMQSSTAVAILTAGFVAAGTLSAPVGLSVLLGADVGTALVANLLLLSPAWIIPALLVLGVTLFLRGVRKNTRQLGRVLVGLALTFVALSMIRETTAPLKDIAGLATVLDYIGTDLFTAFILGAIFTWAVHSSVAAVLLVVTLASSGALPVAGAIALILGANLGGAMIGFVLTLASQQNAREVILGNVLLRGGGAVAALLAFVYFQPDPAWLGPSPALQVIHTHILFNLLAALIGQLVAGPVLALAKRVLPPEIAATTGLEPETMLDDTLLDRPDQAVIFATREVLHLGEMIVAMLSNVIGLYENSDENKAALIDEYERRVDTLHFRTKVFLAKLQGNAQTEEVAQDSMNLAIISDNLEAAGDLISRNLLGMSRKMHSEGLQFSTQGWQELEDFHDRVLANSQLALNVLMTGDHDAARNLVEEKEKVREVEAELQASHIARLRADHSESLPTSNIHQETLRSLKQINTAFTMIAYPILNNRGDLLSSRLSNSAASE